MTWRSAHNELKGKIHIYSRVYSNGLNCFLRQAIFYKVLSFTIK